MTYAEKEDILGIIKFFRPTYTTGNIDDSLQFLATTDVNSALRSKHMDMPATDISDLLKASEICFYLSLTNMVRETEQAFGVIGEETIGRYKKKYENGMPMFFFAQGSSKSFLELLPHETWRMKGYKYVSDYIEAYASSRTDYSQYGCVLSDDTARGHGWDNSVSDWDSGTWSL